MNADDSVGAAQRKSVLLWAAFGGGVVLVTALGALMAGVDPSAKTSTDLFALGVGVVATGASIIVPLRVRTQYLRTAVAPPVASGQPADASTTTAGLLQTVMFIKLAFAETPALLAFSFAMKMDGYSTAGMTLVVLSAILLGLAFPRRSDWELYARQVEAARVGAPVASVL